MVTWNTQLSCQKCGAIYEIEVWNLGHKESDQIACQCCGSVIRSWKNEARSYSISSMVREGTFKLHHEDWEKYVGRRLRFSKGDEIIEGKVLGLDKSVVAATGPTAVDHPWLIETKSDHIDIYPEDGWKIQLI